MNLTDKCKDIGRQLDSLTRLLFFHSNGMNDWLRWRLEAERRELADMYHQADGAYVEASADRGRLSLCDDSTGRLSMVHTRGALSVTGGRA